PFKVAADGPAIESRTLKREAKCSGIPAQVVQRRSGWVHIYVRQLQHGCRAVGMGTVIYVMTTQSGARPAKYLPDNLNSFSIAFEGFGDSFIPSLFCDVLRIGWVSCAPRV